MAKFYVCGVSNGTPCTFSEQSMQRLWERSGGDIARCVRHGSLIDEEIRAESIEDARKKVKEESQSRY